MLFRMSTPGEAPVTVIPEVQPVTRVFPVIAVPGASVTVRPPRNWFPVTTAPVTPAPTATPGAPDAPNQPRLTVTSLDAPVTRTPTTPAGERTVSSSTVTRVEPSIRTGSADPDVRTEKPSTVTSCTPLSENALPPEAGALNVTKPCGPFTARKVIGAPLVPERVIATFST